MYSSNRNRNKLRSLIFIIFFALTSIASAEPTGFDYAGMDLAIKPGDDFYHYALGGWLQSHTIPPGESTWGTVTEMEKNMEARLHEIILNAAHNPTHEDALISSMYQSTLNMELRNKSGIKPLQSLIGKIQQIKDKHKFVRVLTELEFNGISAFYIFDIQPHPKKSDLYAFVIGEQGIGLDAEIYLAEKDTESNHHAEIRNEYLAYIKNILTSSKLNLAPTSAKTILDIETILARGQLPREKSEDPDVINNIVQPDELMRLSPNMQWDNFFKQLNIPKREVIVRNPKYLTLISDIIAQNNLEDLKLFLTYRLLANFAPLLSADFVKVDFDFNQHILKGIQEPLSADQQAVLVTKNYLSNALGKLYVQQYLPPALRSKIKDMVERIKAAATIHFAKLPWLSAAAKTEALKKIDNMLIFIGYADSAWLDYSNLLDINADTPLAQNALLIVKHFNQNRLSKVGQKVKPGEPYTMMILDVDGFYDPSNRFMLSAGILQPPFVTEDDAVTWGAIGFVIAHELTHGFDNQGRLFDAAGNQRDWWSSEDEANYNMHAQVIRDQFDDYVVTFADHTQSHVNGQLTLPENIADLGGLYLAFTAFQQTFKEKPLPDINHFTPEQRFFLGYAQAFRYKITDESLRRMLEIDCHSPWNYRVNGALSQFPEFQKAFHLKDSDPMVMPTARRSLMWRIMD